MHPRLASDLWVSAYLARLRLADIPAYVTAKRDPTSGAVVVKCATLDGAARAYNSGYGRLADERTRVLLALPYETALRVKTALNRRGN